VTAASDLCQIASEIMGRVSYRLAAAIPCPGSNCPRMVGGAFPNSSTGVPTPILAIKKSDLARPFGPRAMTRGGMDASQSKDYVLFMLFIKYASPIRTATVRYFLHVYDPRGASFKDMIALKAKKRHRRQDQHSGHPAAHRQPFNASPPDFPDFNDPNARRGGMRW